MGGINYKELNLFLANIGTSDLGVGERPLSLKEVLQKFEEYGRGAATELRAILLEPAIDEIIKKAILNIKAILFVTKQTPKHEQDTYPIGNYLKQVLEGKYSGKINIELDIISEDPWHWDKMFSHYEERLSHFSEKFEPKFVFVSVSGGTPAQNAALLFNAVSVWENRVKAVYKPRGSQRAVLFEVTEYLLNKIVLREVKTLKKAHSYFIAAELGEKYGVLNRKEANLIKGEHFRNVFDFKRAREYFEEAGLEGKQNLNEIEQLTEKEDTYFLLKELLRNMWVKYEQNEYVDLLGRFYVFKEKVLPLILTKVTGFECEWNKEAKGYPGFEDFLNCHFDVKKKLESKNLTPNPVSPLVCRKILDFLKGRVNLESELIETWKKFCDISQPLVTKRNNTIIGHGFEGCSREDFEDALKKSNTGINKVEDFLKFLTKVVDSLQTD
jgi:hypothetical protein